MNDDYKRGYADAMNWKIQNHLEHLPPAQRQIILSCGCQSDDFGIEAEWNTLSREGKPAIECGLICQKHFEIYDARTPEPEANLKEKNT